jgi:hypothetical protein
MKSESELIRLVATQVFADLLLSLVTLRLTERATRTALLGMYMLTGPCHLGVKVKVKVTLRLTVSQSVCLGVGHPFGVHDQILLFPLFCQKIAFLFSLGALSDERTGLQFAVHSVSGQSRGGLATIHYCLL